MKQSDLEARRSDRWGRIPHKWRVLANFGILVVAATGALLWWLVPDRRIAGNWRDPEVELLNAKMYPLEWREGWVVNYFFNISQSADLARPDKVNRGAPGSGW